MKKVLKQMLTVVAVLMAVFMLLGAYEVKAENKVERLSTSYTSYTKYINSASFTPVIYKTNVKNLKWSSSDTEVATVSKKGKVKIVGVGDTELEISAKGKYTNKKITATIDIHVPEPTIDPYYTNSDYAIKRGEAKTISTIVRNMASGYSVKWESSNEAVATVKGSGKNAIVTGIAPGTTTITGTLKGTESTVEFNVMVKAPTLSVSKTDYTVKKGKTASVTAVLSNSVATDMIEWSSSNENVCRVTASGSNNRTVKIYAEEAGTAVITGKLGDLAIQINVDVPGPVITVSKTEYTLKKGNTTSVSATLTNASALDEVVWDVMDERICQVESSGTNNKKITIYALDYGTTTITGTIGATSISINVLVPNPTLTTSSSIYKTMKLGSTWSPTISLTNAPATDLVVWTSSDTNIAICTGSGTSNKSVKITAMSSGEAEITGTINGLTSVTFYVTVQ